MLSLHDALPICPDVSHDHRCHPWAPRVPAISSLHGVVPATTTAVTRCRRMDSRHHASASGGRYLPETYRIMLLRCAVSGAVNARLRYDWRTPIACGWDTKMGSRSEERRVGKESFRTVSFWWSPTS